MSFPIFRAWIWLVGVCASLNLGTVAPASTPAFPLVAGAGKRHLVDQRGVPFFVMGDTPWFLQKLPLADVRRVMDDRLAKGFNTLFLELLDDSRIPSRDGLGHVAFEPATDITRPVEAYWDYAEAVLDEAEQRGFFVILSELWYGYGQGLWMHHIDPDKTRVYAAFLGKRFARFRNLMWMHAGDRNPDANLDACTPVLRVTAPARACGDGNPTGARPCRSGRFAKRL